MCSFSFYTTEIATGLAYGFDKVMQGRSVKFPLQWQNRNSTDTEKENVFAR